MIAAGLDRAEFELVLFALERYEWHREFEALGVEIVTLRSGSPASGGVAEGYNNSSGPQLKRRLIPKAVGWYLGLLKEILDLTRLFGKRRVDLLHSNNAGAEPAPIAARLAGIPIVIATWHVDSTYDLDNVRSGFCYRMLEVACMQSLHHAISVSRTTAEDWAKRCHLSSSYRKRITVIHNGIDALKFQRRNSVEDAKAATGLSGRLVIGSMGRLEPAKGYEYLIRALPAVIEKHPETLVRIAGRGELHAPLTSLARELGVEQHLEFRGFIADIRTFLEAIDVYVQPSLCEALPIAILEACAVGMPIVASNVGGVAECVEDGATGFVVSPRMPGLLGERLIQLWRDPVLRERMGRESQRTVMQEFRCEDMLAKTIMVYRNVLAEY